MSTEEWALEFKNKQMYEWTLPSTASRESQIAHWMAFIVLSLCTIYLSVHAWNAKGPSGTAKYFYGYREEMMISIYVNLFAAVAYYGKVVADTHGHHYKNAGPVIPVMGNYAYMDYVTTCPLLVYDLLGQLRAPYKMTCSVLIFLVLLCGVVTNFYEGDHFRGPAYAWFGLGVAFFLTDYFLLYKIITAQYAKLENLSYHSHAKKALFPLKLSIGTFFVVWVVFPVIWILSDAGLGMINQTAVDVLHAFCDVLAKSVYGFTLARFRTYFDKKLFMMLEELGYDGEAEMEHLDKELAHDVVIDGPSSKKEHPEHHTVTKLGSSLMHNSEHGANLDTQGEIVHALGPPPHSTTLPPPFHLTSRGDVLHTPRGDGPRDSLGNGHHNTPAPPRSPRRHSVVGLLAQGTMSAPEVQRSLSQEADFHALSAGGGMKMHAPLKPHYHEPGHGYGHGNGHGPASKEGRLMEIQRQMEAINRELARASAAESAHPIQMRAAKPQSEFDIPNMYDEYDPDLEKEKRRRRRDRKERKARNKAGSPYDEEEGERGVC